MSFLFPGWIVLAAAASLVVAGIHLISWRLPRTVILPTARFVPDEPARRAARTLRPADLLLLALRVTILMTGGVALARPVIASNPSGQATVVAVEWSTSFADSAELLATVRALPSADKTSYVVFDTSAHLLDGDAALGRAIAERPVASASLSVGLLAATREARRLARDYERVGIALVSSFTQGAYDEATDGIRGTWRDSILARRVAAVSRRPERASLELSGTGDDPVLAGIRLAQANGLVRGTARVVRGVASASDSAWVDSGRVLVLWPNASSGATEHVDGVHVGSQTTIGHFIIQPIPDSGRVVARWVNGNAAAREVATRSGCVRTIGFDVPDAGDFVLTPSFQRVAAELVGPCQGAAAHGDVMSDSAIALLAAPPATGSTIDVADDGSAPNRIAAVIAIVAILLMVVELLVRRRSGGLFTRAEQVA